MEPLSERELDLVRGARRAVLATLASDGAPRLVPITFVVINDMIWTPIDEKPKRVTHPLELARVRDIARRPRVSVLVDHWDENWSQLGWVRLFGHALLVGPDSELAGLHAQAVRLLGWKYSQYSGHSLETRPLIRIAIDGATSWFATP